MTGALGLRVSAWLRSGEVEAPSAAAWMSNRPRRSVGQVELAASLGQVHAPVGIVVVKKA